MDRPQTAHANRGLLSYSSPSKLILREHGSTASSSNASLTHSVSLDSSHNSAIDSPAGSVISQIEDILEQVIDCIINKKKELVIRLKSRRRSHKEILEIDSSAVDDNTDVETRTIRFPGGTPREAWRFSEA